MGEVSILTVEQKFILKKIAKDKSLSASFYFSGGTALSEVYLKHRRSVDLDFFADSEFDSQTIFTKLTQWSKEREFEITPDFVDPTHIYILTFVNKKKLKIDFAHYPYKKLDKEKKYKGLRIDSLLDIAANKLLLVSQRSEAKDFVDLYYLLEEFSIWDLIEGVKKKFSTKLDPFILASDFLAVEDFEFMPKMLKPLTLEEVRKFYRARAKKLGKKVVI